ncbi:MAG: hypothetical protein D4R65_10525 [Verrucomicrobiaceae bacterium]|nr:MAG: hypothetical protein D4R65_10525 [Verrucomicrobiaceae bacterium]
MPAVTLKAHYDGKQILLDEPFVLPAHCDLMVTVLQDSSDRSDFFPMAIAAIARAYGENEPEYGDAK